MLNFNIRGENIEVTPAIREHVEEKLKNSKVTSTKRCERNSKCQFKSVQ